MLETFDLKKLPMKDFCVMHCCILHCSPGHNKGSRFTTNHMLRYVISGTGSFHTGRAVLPLKPGDMFISHPGQTTLFTADPTEPVDLYLVRLSCGEPFSSLLRQDVIHAPELKAIFQKFMECQYSNSREWAVYAVAAEMFSFLAQMQITVVHTIDPIDEALHRIRNSFDLDLRVEDLAASLGMSRSYFFRQFRQRMGMSPQAYILRFRMNTAKKLLAENKMSISDVSRQVGYEDTCTFSRLFKKHVGITPSQYRAKKTAP